MSNKFYVGLDLTGFENNSIQRPVSRVTLKVDAEKVLTAGDDTGLELTADCPHATQGMVDSILEQLRGTKYQMYSATDVNIDPRMELGDGITAGGVYSVIARIDDDGSGFPSVSAPGKDELEDEYPAGGPMTQIITRSLAETRSRITKTAEEIRLEVEKVSDGVTELSASFSVEVGKINSRIQDTNGNLTQLAQTVNSFTLSVENGSTSSSIKLMADGAVISSQNITMNGLVTYTGLSNGTTTINGACIKTGRIDAERLNLTGKLTFSDFNPTAQSALNTASSAASTLEGWTYSGTTYIDGSKIMAGTVIASKLKGGTVELMNQNGVVSAKMGISGVYENDTGAMHIQTRTLFLDSQCAVKTTLWIGDFESGNEDGSISANGNDFLDITGCNGHKVRLCYEGSEGGGGTYKTLLTAGYDTVTFVHNGSSTVHCYNNLDMHSYSVLNSSDRRLKTNIRPAEFSALDVIRSMQTYSFDWREDGRHERLGFVAQQLGKIMPDFVDVSPADGHYSTKDMKIIPYLVKAVQELSAKFDELKGEEK